MKGSLLAAILTVVLVFSGFHLDGQSAPSQNIPPQTMRLCIQPHCLNLTWAGDHYEGREDGSPTLVWRYWITNWDSTKVEFSGKTVNPADGVYPLEATFTGELAPGGGSILNGSAAWRVGYSQSGIVAYTLVWDNQPSNKAAIGDIAVAQAPRRSTTNPNILLPPGASEAFASYPAEVRAILQPEYPLTPADAERPCSETKQITDANTAVEIGKFAFRAGEIDRAGCWIDYSIQPLQSVRGPSSAGCWHS
jgi:hypothetical protein